MHQTTCCAPYSVHIRRQPQPSNLVSYSTCICRPTVSGLRFRLSSSDRKSGKLRALTARVGRLRPYGNSVQNSFQIWSPSYLVCYHLQAHIRPHPCAEYIHIIVLSCKGRNFRNYNSVDMGRWVFTYAHTCQPRISYYSTSEKKIRCCDHVMTPYVVLCMIF